MLCPRSKSAFCLSAAFLVLAFTGTPSAAASASSDAACRASEITEDRLERIGPRGELVLASGRHVLLDGIRWPDEGPDVQAATSWLLARASRNLSVSTRGDPDRWGRTRIDALAEPDAADADPEDLAEGLVAEGLAAVDAGEADALCRTDLLSLEAGPRAARRGIWAALPRDARDGPALSAVAGRFTVAQGRVLHVGERPSRTYLDFAPYGESGLTVTVPKRTWRMMAARGLTAAALQGRLARVRGVIELRRSPTLDIVAAEMFEIADGNEAGLR